MTTQEYLKSLDEQIAAWRAVGHEATGFIELIVGKQIDLLVNQQARISKIEKTNGISIPLTAQPPADVPGDPVIDAGDVAASLKEKS